MATKDAIQSELDGLNRTLASTELKNDSKNHDQILHDMHNLQRQLQKVQKEICPFEYVHQEAMAYIGSDRAIADITWSGSIFASSGGVAYFFWRAAYLSMCFSSRNKTVSRS
ncbi:hypothetical protein ASPWEDRAFT_182616 [Aspergillus wentii DTO 134E9]|uniref:External alternative NADH-ubiquinone oxidoreductase-like C-terminal domain-containing protein n=1 Tax=Aspergillus wentii DTO 134E9 TaxID=1073089 RepID=A0A1L9RS43_ASPWE|nr:uncharacterized protein ASPWEDRAFT_182616 [Aspergillus wentii DTO 134E9]OJJ37786.1 hypothetical protein ASPWEDRAFT_182616 [Aspergillus wentii DTO 134E9]